MKRHFKDIKKYICVCFICIIAVLSVSAKALPKEVYVGGMPFGVRFDSGEVTVINTSSFLSNGQSVSPSKDAGICPGDIIKSVNGISIKSSDDVLNAMNSGSDAAIDVIVEREGIGIAMKLTPQKSDDTNKMQLGIMLKDSSAGIGTITYINEDSRSFAGLGHGICDSESGKLLKIDKGYISDVVITDICKGEKGAPGELHGNISNDKKGELILNTEVGVYGVMLEPQDGLGKKIQTAEKNEIHTGKATILCTLDNNDKEEFEVEISKIQNLSSSPTKNFIIKVTDSDLLEKTGGIVQGMSGSPIVQNGKLVGAVTHVFVNDPTRGYGIFIENMLAEAEKIK